LNERIGELLVKENLLSSEQLSKARQEAAAQGRRLGAQITALGFMDENELSEFVAKQYGVPSINLADFTIEPEVLALIPEDVATKHNVVPVNRAGSTLILATADPSNIFALDDIKFLTGYNIQPVVASEQSIRAAIETYYAEPEEDILDDVMAGFDDAGIDFVAGDDEEDARKMAKEAEDAPVVKLVNLILTDAIKKNASDIHIEPYEKSFRVRYRIDGLLYEVMKPPLKLKNALTSRLKIMSELDIAERRLPQDGRINLQIAGQFIDVRVATIPSVEGESVSLRLLGQEKFNLDKLRIEPDLRAEVETLLKKPNGIILVTGPTGSGKSTTLYTFLSQLNTEHRRIVTIEDPVENKLPGVVQIAVRPEINLSFATGLRSILRGDPNVVMIGEMRDLETAEIAIRAALTGHLVFSTLHTNDAIGGIMRLIDMGVEPFLVSSSVRAFIAQRLVRVLCQECRQVDPDAKSRLHDQLQYNGPIISPVYRAKEGGCEACRATGYRGRMSIYELVRLTPAMGELVTHKASNSQLYVQAYKDGYRPMREYGVRKILAGLTSIDEVISVTVAESEQ